MQHIKKINSYIGILNIFLWKTTSISVRGIDQYINSYISVRQETLHRAYQGGSLLD